MNRCSGKAMYLCREGDWWYIRVIATADAAGKERQQTLLFFTDHAAAYVDAPGSCSVNDHPASRTFFPSIRIRQRFFRLLGVSEFAHRVQNIVAHGAVPLERSLSRQRPSLASLRYKSACSTASNSEEYPLLDSCISPR